MKLASIALALLIAPGASFALDLADGDYETINDGAEGVLSIRGDYASLGIGSGTCAGSVEGKLVKQSDGAIILQDRSDGQSCDITITESSTAIASMYSNEGCFYFHGASCEFSGTVTNLTVPFNIEAVDAGFASFDEGKRRSIQQYLIDGGFYSGGVDGKTGPGTRLAVREAANRSFVSDSNISLATPAGVTVFLEGLIRDASPTPVQAVEPQSADEPVEELIQSETEVNFLGDWECYADGVETDTKVFDNHFSITDDAIAWKEMGRTVNITEASALDAAGTNFRMKMSDGYIVHAFNVKATDMYLVAAGSAFFCQR